MATTMSQRTCCQTTRCLLCHFILSSELLNYKVAQAQGPRVGVQACLWLQVPPVMYCCCRAVRVVGDLFLVNGGGLLWGQAPSRGSESVLSRQVQALHILPAFTCPVATGMSVSCISLSPSACGHLRPDQFLKRKLFLWGSLDRPYAGEAMCLSSHMLPLLVF